VKTESAPAQAPPVAPAAFSFDERKKKEIILRPAAAQASRPENEPSKEDKAVETKDTITTESPTEAAKEAPETEKRAPTPVQKNVTGDKNAPESTRPNAYAGPSAKGETARKEQKQAGSKRDSLGFSEKKPVDVVADTMEGLEKGKIIVFRGNVIAKQEDLNLFSDILTAYVSEETNEIERAKAEGNVKIVKADRTATCKEAFFYNDKGEIILKGDVVVFSGKDKLSGDVVTYYINEDRVYVEGEKDKRAKATVHPK
jgi:lipopolysaccharide export system protein LptA